MQREDMQQAMAERLAAAAQQIDKPAPAADCAGEDQEAPMPGGLLPKTTHQKYVTDCFESNQVGDANLFNFMFKGKYAFVAEWEKFLVWAGHHWRIDMLNRSALADMERLCEAYHRADKAVPPTGNPKIDGKRQKALQRRLDSLRSASGRRSVLECVTTIDGAPVITAKDDLDQQPYLLATPNGVVDFRTGQCSPGQPEQYILKHCPTPWPENVDLSRPIEEIAPTFANYLATCMDEDRKDPKDREMVNFLIRLLGYGLIGKKSLHVWAIMYGPLSRNGKDTLMNTMRHVLGDLHVNFSVSMLTEKKIERDSSAPQVDLMAIRGARMAYCSEANSRQVLNQAKIKEMTGGGYITARGNNDKEMTTWQQNALLFMLTNYLPKIDASDDGFNARTLCIEWPVKFVEHPTKEYERQLVDRMDERLREEAPGILACLVKGAMEVMATGSLGTPDKVLQYTRERISDFDDIGKFLQECCDVEEPPTGGRDWQTRTKGSDFMAVLNWWCRSVLGNAYPYTPKKVTPSLEKKGIPTRKSGNMFYMGVTIKPDIQAEFDAAQNTQGGKYDR